MRRIPLFLTVFTAAILLAAFAPAEQSGSWDLDGVTKIRIDGVSGDVIIVPAEGGEASVELRADVKPESGFKSRVKRSGSVLHIAEDWNGNTNGSVTWTIHLPHGGKALSINISTASGDLECSDVAVKLDFETASGDIGLSNVDLQPGCDFSTASGDYSITDMTISEDAEFSTASGDIALEDLVIESDCEFSTASGDIAVKDCTCGDGVEFSSASGDVEVRNSSLKGGGEFSSASGDVLVALGSLPPQGLSASSASGDVTLDVEDFGGDYTLIITKRKNKGHIRCPFGYAEEEEFEKNHHTYVRKVVKSGSGNPVIELSTASGSVVIKQ